MTGSFPTPGDARDQAFHDHLNRIHNIVKDMVGRADDAHHAAGGRSSYIDLLKRAGVSQQHLCDEVVSMLVGGFHTTGAFRRLGGCRGRPAPTLGPKG